MVEIFQPTDQLHPGDYVASVSNSDGTLTISPTTGAVIASLNLSHANTWNANLTVANGFLLKGQYSNLAGSAYINPDGSAVFGGGNTIIDSSGNLTVPGFKLTASPTNGYILTSDGSGNGTWQPGGGGGGGTPGGTTTNMQYNAGGGVFGGLINSNVDATNGLLGINQATPFASVHAGTSSVTIGTPSGSTVATVIGPGYSFGSGNKTYWINAERTVNGSPIYSATYEQVIYNEDSSGNYEPSSFSANINYGGSGYIATGNSFAYQIWAAYTNTGVFISLGTITASAGPDDSSSNPYQVDLAWTAAPVVPPYYLIARSLNGAAQDFLTTTSTNLSDQNTGWASSPATSPLQYQVQVTAGIVADATNYQFENATTNTNYIGANPSFDAGAWSGGSILTSPSTYTFSSLISDGTTEICKLGGGFAAFAGTPVTQRTGDAMSALSGAGYNLIATPFVYAPDVKYLLSGNPIASNSGVLLADTGLASPAGTGIDQNGFATLNKLTLGAVSVTLAPDGTFTFDGTKMYLQQSGSADEVRTGIVGVTVGGTGLTGVSQGDILYGSNANVYSRLAKNTTATRYLSNTGTSNNPAWAQINLTNGVTGILPIANGGTGASTAPYVNDATNATLTRSGTGPYTLGLNLSNANTWTGQQTFNTSAAIFGVGARTPLIYPAADSTTAILFTKADGSTVVGTIDTTNTRWVIGNTGGGATAETLDVFGNGRAGRWYSKTGSLAFPNFACSANNSPGMYSSGTNLLSLVTNSLERITIDASGNVNVPIALTVASLPIVRLLASTTGINAKTVANTLAYTNSTGKNVILTKAIIRCTAASAITVGPTMGIGTASGTSDIFAATALTVLTTTSNIFGFDLVGASVLVPNGGTIYINVTVASTGTSQTIAADLSGYAI